MTIRAIHIEMLHSLDANSFINALMRFVARRGYPKRIRSDNGTNFIDGEKEIRKSISEWNDNNKLRKYLLLNEIEWIFNPPLAPHMGGAWERMVRSVKKVMNVIIRNHVLDDERLNTVFCEVESIVNGRPITQCSDNVADMEPLTPNHLLFLRGGLKAPPGKFVKDDMYNRRWRHVQFLADAFWKRWVRQYLPTLQKRQKWFDIKENLRIGDIVLVLDEVTSRKSWPMGRVTKITPGRDGLVRSVEVKTNTSVFVRPVTKLCFLESSAEEESD